MNFRVTLLQNLPDRAPLAVQARYRLRDGTLKTWPVAVEPERGAAVLDVESHRDMLLPHVLTRSLVAHYPTAPLQEERQISSVRPAVEAAPAAETGDSGPDPVREQGRGRESSRRGIIDPHHPGKPP